MPLGPGLEQSTWLSHVKLVAREEVRVEHGIRGRHDGPFPVMRRPQHQRHIVLERNTCACVVRGRKRVFSASADRFSVDGDRLVAADQHRRDVHDVLENVHKRVLNP